MTISYDPSRDELVLKLRPVIKQASKQFGPFRLWSDKEDSVCAIAISAYREQLREFRKRRRWIQLGGIWKGVKIKDGDIKEFRQELLKKLEERGAKY